MIMLHSLHVVVVVDGSLFSADAMFIGKCACVYESMLTRPLTRRNDQRRSLDCSHFFTSPAAIVLNHVYEICDVIRIHLILYCAVFI